MITVMTTTITIAAKLVATNITTVCITPPPNPSPVDAAWPCAQYETRVGRQLRGLELESAAPAAGRPVAFPAALGTYRGLTPHAVSLNESQEEGVCAVVLPPFCSPRLEVAGHPSCWNRP